jgi:nucleoid-associated protein YgaU
MGEFDNLQAAKLEIEGDPMPLQCLFNPKEYTITKSNTWNAKQAAGVSLPPVQFGGGAPAELSFEILLDHLEGAHPIQPDINRLFLAMEANPALVTKAASGKPTPRPPKVTFSWGATISFEAALKSLSVQFVRFGPEGEPTRAQIKLTLVQTKRSDSRTGRGPLPAQNPTTTAIAEPGTHTVRDGDSLPSIAYGAYGDPTAWRAIAQANGIDDPLRLRRGSRLSIPDVSP